MTTNLLAMTNVERLVEWDFQFHVHHTMKPMISNHRVRFSMTSVLPLISMERRINREDQFDGLVRREMLLMMMKKTRI